MNLLVKKMFERVGTYFYFFPTYNQGKKILWDGRDGSGFKFMDHFPKEVIAKKNEAEMKIETTNGSLFQIIGTDNIDSVVGTNPVGCVFSEYSLQDPRAWDFMRPILAENDGWALFNFTPRGKNHAHTLFKSARDSDEWFCQMLTADDTNVLSKEVLDRERVEMIQKNGDDSLFLQEYYCNFEAAITGSYYGNHLKIAEDQGRILDLSYEPTLAVDTFWDLGIDDATAIWFVQSHLNEVRVIDYYEAQGEGLSHFFQVLKKRAYTYGTHYFPHDAEVRELSTGRSRKDFAQSLGIRPIRVLPKIAIEDGIEAARMILPKCWFDKTKCERGLDALRSYHKEYDEINQTYRTKPHHDWSSHAADAFRYLATGFRTGLQGRRRGSDQDYISEVRQAKARGYEG